MLRNSPPQGQLQTVTTQTIIQMFHEASGFEITPNEVLVICLLKNIQDKNLMVKVQEQMTKTMLKKQKEKKERKEEAKTGKTEKEKTPTSWEKKETSEELRKRDLSN